MNLAGRHAVADYLSPGIAQGISFSQADLWLCSRSNSSDGALVAALMVEPREEYAQAARSASVGLVA